MGAGPESITAAGGHRESEYIPGRIVVGEAHGSPDPAGAQSTQVPSPIIVGAGASSSWIQIPWVPAIDPGKANADPSGDHRRIDWAYWSKKGRKSRTHESSRKNSA